MLTHYPECSSPASPTLQQYRHSNPWYRFSEPAHTHYLDREASERYLCTRLTTWFHLEGVVWNRSSVQANAVIQGIFHLKEKIQPHCWKKKYRKETLQALWFGLYHGRTANTTSRGLSDPTHCRCGWATAGWGAKRVNQGMRLQREQRWRRKRTRCWEEREERKPLRTKKEEKTRAR